MAGHQEVAFVVFKVVFDGSTRAAYYFDENLVEEVIRQYLASRGAELQRNTGAGPDVIIISSGTEDNGEESDQFADAEEIGNEDNEQLDDREDVEEGLEDNVVGGAEQEGEEDSGDNGELEGEGEEGYLGDDETEEIEGKGLFRCVLWHAPPTKRKWSDVSD